MKIFINDWMDDSENPMVIISIPRKDLKDKTYLGMAGLVQKQIKELDDLKIELIEKEERRIDNAE